MEGAVNINFQKCLLNLRTSGLSMAELARQMGHKDKGQYLGRVSRGEVKRMEMMTGLKLLDLHLERCREKHQELL